MNLRVKLSLLIILFSVIIPFNSIFFSNNDKSITFVRDISEKSEPNSILERKSIISSKIDFENYSNIDRRRFFFDTTHRQLFDLWDTGHLGYSDMVLLLEKYHLEVSTIKYNLSSQISNLTSNDILLLSSARYGNYSEAEITKLTDFVEMGGKLIVFGDHDIWNVHEFQNELLKNFGIQLTSRDLEDPINHAGNEKTWVIFNSSYFNLKNLSILFGSALNITGKAFPIANSSHTANYPNQAIMAGYNNSNGGKVFVCADPEWLLNFNGSLGGIHYGNNSKLLLKVLDWFYKTNLSIEVQNNVQIDFAYTCFTQEANSNFSLKMKLKRLMNVSASISGGCLPSNYVENCIGTKKWNILVQKDGFIRFQFTINHLKINISKIIYFFTEKGDKSVFFLNPSCSRGINPSPDGLLKFACLMNTKYYYSIFEASNSSLISSISSCIVLAHPLQDLNLKTLNDINNAHDIGSKLFFMNSRITTLKIQDLITEFLTSVFFKPKSIPINTISSFYGLNFTHFIVCDNESNINNKIYFPCLKTICSDPKSLNCFAPSVIDANPLYEVAVTGLSDSWGEDRCVFGLSAEMAKDNKDINNTNVLSFNESILATGLLYRISNELFDKDHPFENGLVNWIQTGEFCFSENIDRSEDAQEEDASVIPEEEDPSNLEKNVITNYGFLASYISGLILAQIGIFYIIKEGISKDNFQKRK